VWKQWKTAFVEISPQKPMWSAYGWFAIIRRVFHRKIWHMRVPITHACRTSRVIYQKFDDEAIISCRERE